MPVELVEYAKSLGIATPLVAILLWLLRQSTQERQMTNKMFIDALQSTLINANATQTSMVATMRDVIAAIKENTEKSTDEHTRLIDAIGKARFRGES